MERILYSYALTKSLYEQGHGILETIMPFIIRVLAKDERMLSLDLIKQQLKVDYELIIPDYVLTEVLRKCCAEGYLNCIREKGYLTSPKGYDYYSSLLTEKDVERRANYLAEEFSAFLRDSGFGEVSIEEAMSHLLDFIQRNLTQLSLYINSPKEFVIDKGNIFTRAIINFILKIEKSRPDAYEVIIDLIYGSIICTFIQAGEEPHPSTLKDVEVFIDTNTMFSILGLHYPEINRPCQELLQLLEKEDCKLFVFDFTVDEMLGVLGVYAKQYNTLWENVKVDTIYSSLKSLGKTPADVRLLMANIEEHIMAQGITIYNTGIKVSTQLIKDAPNLGAYKPANNQRSINHDIIAVELIRRLRKMDARKLEDSKAIFITSDIKLARFNLIEYLHSERLTVSEVILDKFLTTLLWLKNPSNSKIPLFSAIAAHSKALFVDKNVWTKFCKKLQVMHDDQKVNTKDIGVLFYSQSIEDFLIMVDDPNNINEAFILDNIEIVKLKIEDDLSTKDDIIRKKDILLVATTQEKSDTDANLNYLVEKIKNISAISSQFISYSIVFGLLYFVFLMLSKVDINNTIPYLTILGFLGLEFKVLKVQNKIMIWVNSYIKRFLRKTLFLNDRYLS